MTSLIALALMLSGTAISETEAAASEIGNVATDVPAAAPQPTKKKAKKVCKDNVAATGSRIAKRVCKTEEEWAAKEDGQEIGTRSATSRSDLENVGLPTGRERPN
jgi:hypothetical protein